MVSRQVLLNALTVVQSIEETLALADEEDFKENDDEEKPTMSDCDLPDHIADPFELLRIVCGDDYVRDIEYVGDIEYIASIIESHVKDELQKLGKQSVDELDDEEDSED